jgi:hypothetical protein
MLMNVRWRVVASWAVLFAAVVVAAYFLAHLGQRNPANAIGAPSALDEQAVAVASTTLDIPTTTSAVNSTGVGTQKPVFKPGYLEQIPDLAAQDSLTPQRFRRQPFADVVKRLTQDMASGDSQAPLELANIYKLCRRYQALGKASDKGAVAILKLCMDVPPRPERIDELVEIAVQRGNAEAVLEQHYYIPPVVLHQLRSEESGRWIRQLENRLATLASQGRYEAHLQLAEIYAGKFFWRQDLAAAQRELQLYLAQAPTENHRRMLAQNELDRVVWLQKQQQGN